MGYYSGRGDCMYGRGDYYRGDYYRGDGIFGTLGKLAKGVLSVVPGPIGAIGRIITGTPRASVSLGPGPGLIGKPTLGLPPGGGAITPFFPGSPIGTTGGGPGMAMVPGRGWCLITRDGRQVTGKPNKSTYVTRGGGTSRWPQEIMVHPAGTECVKRRRMNVTNPRALRRSIRRAQGFAKLARRVLSFVSAKPPKGKPVYKRKR